MNYKTLYIRGTYKMGGERGREERGEKRGTQQKRQEEGERRGIINKFLLLSWSLSVQESRDVYLIISKGGINLK